MNKLGKVPGINLLILLFYMVWIYCVNKGTSEAALGILLLSAFAITAHVILNLVIAFVYFVKRDKEKGKAFLLSAGIVLVVGFSSCLGASGMFG
jgi:hypothetical protein